MPHKEELPVIIKWMVRNGVMFEKIFKSRIDRSNYLLEIFLVDLVDV